MKLQLKGIELEVPEGALIEISDDGTKVKITGIGTEVMETIRVVEIPGPETIRVVEVPVAPTIIYNQPPYNPTWTHPIKPRPDWTWTGITGGSGTWNGNTIKLT